MLIIRYFTLVAILLASNMPVAFAATDGELNPFSVGDFDITVTIPNRVRISDLDTIDLGIYVLDSGNVRANDDVCVYSNTPTARYDVTITGSGASGAYTVTNGTDTVPFSVLWNETTGTAGNGLIFSGNTLNLRENANSQSTDCSVGGLTSNIEVLFGNFNNVSNGVYTGTLTVVIEPR